MTILAELEDAEVLLGRLNRQLGRSQRRAGQFFEQIVEAAIRVGHLGRGIGGHCQIDAAHAAEKRFQEAASQDLDRFLRLTMTGEGQLQEIVALLAAREDERLGERPGAEIDRGGAGGPDAVGERKPVVKAKRRLGGVQAVTFTTLAGHGPLG